MRKKITAAARSVGNACLVLLAEPCALFVLAGLSIKMFEGLFGFHAAMRAAGETVHGFGLLALELSRPWSSIFYHLGLVFLLSGLLGTDESLSQKLLRENRGRWIMIRLLTILSVCIGYFALVQLLLLLISGGWNFSGTWDRLLASMASGYSPTDFTYDAAPLIVYGFSPWIAWACTSVIAICVWFILGCLMFGTAQLWGQNAAILLGGSLCIWDYFVYWSLPGSFYLYSPLSWTKLSIIGDRFASGGVSLGYVKTAIPALLALSLAFAILSAYLKKELAYSRREGR